MKEKILEILENTLYVVDGKYGSIFAKEEIAEMIATSLGKANTEQHEKAFRAGYDYARKESNKIFCLFDGVSTTDADLIGVFYDRQKADEIAKKLRKASTHKLRMFYIDEIELNPDESHFLTTDGKIKNL